jgi:hypothetical protein
MESSMGSVNPGDGLLFASAGRRDVDERLSSDTHIVEPDEGLIIFSSVVGTCTPDIKQYPGAWHHVRP